MSLPSSAAGPPAPGALVLLQRYGGIPVFNPVADIEAQSDASGNFVIPALATGTYSLFVTAQGYATLTKVVVISNQSVSLGTLTLAQGATLSGSLYQPDGSSPSPDEVSAMAAVTSNLSQILFASLTSNPVTGGDQPIRSAASIPGSATRSSWSTPRAAWRPRSRRSPWSSAPPGR